MSNRTRRVALALLGALILCAMSCIGATSSLASAPLRTYDSQITGFARPEGVTIGANDEVWVADPGKGSLLSRYDAYPSLTKIGEQTGSGRWGGGNYVRGPSFNTSNGFLYAPAAGGQFLYNIFDNFGDYYGQLQTTGNAYGQWSAVDNSNSSYSRGRVYLYTNSEIKVFDGYGNPIDLSGSASYIEANRITGTPAGKFSADATGASSLVGAGITVDSEGNIWVTDSHNVGTGVSELDEFSPEGLFMRRITLNNAGGPPPTSGGNPGLSYKVFGSSNAGFGGIAVDPTNGDILVSDPISFVIDEFSPTGEYLGQVDGSETPAGQFAFRCNEGNGGVKFLCADDVLGIAVNSQGYLYATDGHNGVVNIFSPRRATPTIEYKSETNPGATSATVNATVDPNGTSDITVCQVDYVADADYNKPETSTPYAYGASAGSTPCVPDPSGANFTGPADVQANLSGLTTEAKYHYRVTIANADGTTHGIDQTFVPHKVLGLRADPPTDVTAGTATLHGSFVGNGTPTSYYFEWGVTPSYGNQSEIPPGTSAGSPSGPARTNESFAIDKLKPATVYHFRVVAKNGSGTSLGGDETFKTLPSAPAIRASIGNVHSNGVRFGTEINPGGGDTAYHFEYGTSPCSQVPNPCSSVPTTDAHIGSNLGFDKASRNFEGLDPDTTYYFRVVATNSAGTVVGADKTFATQPFEPNLSDPCPNKLARQQSGAGLLLDCRAYELVSSAHAGGYDVESNLVPGLMPFGGYPRAESPHRVLYGVHSGAIPGTGNPTNRGVDPYIATRGSDGWSTSYVGIPADAPEGDTTSLPFSSTLAGADSSLDSFAFSGPKICDPCFPDGSQGIPVRNPDGSLTQGMVGSQPVATPVAAGVVKKHFSDDGSHFVFGSEQQFELAGNPDDGNVTIYERDIEAGTTEVVSTDGSGTALADGDNVAELDVSSDGSRVLIGDLIGTDVDGSKLWDLYMHVAGNPDSIHLTPGVPGGARYDGMTSDGSKAFLSTADVPTGAVDGDTSIDIYRADVGSSSATLNRISTGSGVTGDTNSCHPSADWNSVTGGENCGVVAIGGGGGVASRDGTIYFLAPEQLDGPSNGEQDQPNLFVSRPGAAPHFVATIDTTTGRPPLPLSFDHDFGSFTEAAALTVDQTNGDVYVLDATEGTVSRFKADGTPHNFTCATCSGNTLSGFAFLGGASQVAIDNSGPASSGNGDIYVTNTFSGTVDIFDSTGQYLGSLNGAGNANGALSLPCGVAVNQTNGDVYIADAASGPVWRYSPSVGMVTEANYSGGIEASTYPCGLAAHGNDVYAGNTFGGELARFHATDFTLGPPAPITGTTIAPSVTAVGIDPANGDLYADDGTQILQFDSGGTPIKTFGSAELTATSTGVAVYGENGTVYVSSGDHVAVFVNPPPPIDNPTVVDAVSDGDNRHTADFQVTPDGSFAAFPTAQALPTVPAVENAGYQEIYRYDASAEALECVSCSPTHADALGGAAMASNGLSLTDDGRVFFDSDDVLALRDADNRKDVYEWETPGTGGCFAGSANPNYSSFTGACLSLVSTGASPFDSSLLSATADGTDAYFFTHDSLVGEDENGPVVKIYDARTDGGFFSVPPPARCVASDECHGPGTQAAGAPAIGTIAGTPANHKVQQCRKGFVKKRGKCVRKPKRRHRGTGRSGHRQQGRTSR